MPITVECTCGERMKVRDEAAGKNIKCRKCGLIVVVPTTPDPPPDPPIVVHDTPPKPARAPRPADAATSPAAGRRPPPWEIWGVLALLGISLLGSVVKLAQRPGGLVGTEMSATLFVGLGGAVLSIIMLSGVLGRTDPGWWLSVVPGSLGVIACFVVPSFIPKGSAAEEPETFLNLAALLWIVAIGLLISCRARSAYDRWCTA